MAPCIIRTSIHRLLICHLDANRSKKLQNFPLFFMLCYVMLMSESVESRDTRGTDEINLIPFLQTVLFSSRLWTRHLPLYQMTP